MQTVIYGSHAKSHAQNDSGRWNPTAQKKGSNKEKKRSKLEAVTNTSNPTFIFSIYLKKKKKAWLKFHLAQK